MKSIINNSYPGFDYSPGEIAKYIQAGEIFTLMLVNKSIIHFYPEDIYSFKEWLEEHQILDIRGNKLEVTFPNYSHLTS